MGHGDGTFHTKSKYFAQLYTIHAYFPPAKYDQAVDKVWVKRVFPCAGILAKKSKDYECIIKVLRTVAIRYGYILDPDQIMIDFEIAAKKAFEKVFPRCKAIGCLFHFSQSLFKMFCKTGLKHLYLENEVVLITASTLGLCMKIKQILLSNIWMKWRILS
jgi:hypothetical protein